MESYELVKDIEAGNFGVARLMRHKETKQLVAIKYIERGHELLGSCSSAFVVLEGSVRMRLDTSSSSLFQVSATATTCRLCCIQGQNQLLELQLILLQRSYLEENILDRKTIQRIMAVKYKIPDYVHISQDCRHLLSRIFVVNPAKRITIKEIKSHPWFLKNLSRELTEAAQMAYYKKENPTFSLQSVEEVMKIVEEAKTPPVSCSVSGAFGGGWGVGARNRKRMKKM